MNRIILMGRITNNLELKTTPNGTAVCSFRLAADRNHQKKGEEKTTDFFNITCWRGTAEFITRRFNKGNLILVEGEMQTRQYTDKNGNTQMWYEVVAENVYFTGEKTGSTSQEAPQSSPTATTAPAPATNSANVVAEPPSEVDDDYPF